MKFIFEGKTVSYGNLQGTHHCRAVFSGISKVKKIVCSDEKNYGMSKFRRIHFKDAYGEAIEKWTHTNGKQFHSSVEIYSTNFPDKWPGKEVEIPEGH